MEGHTQTGSTSAKGEGRKENRRKSSERKKKRTETNVQRVYGICVGNDLLKLINNSCRENKENHKRDGGLDIGY